MTATQRTVAEIIGWTFTYDLTDPRGERWGHWHHEAERVPGCWPANCYSTDTVPPAYTADDLSRHDPDHLFEDFTDPGAFLATIDRLSRSDRVASPI